MIFSSTFCELKLNRTNVNNIHITKKLHPDSLNKSISSSVGSD